MSWMLAVWLATALPQASQDRFATAPPPPFPTELALLVHDGERFVPTGPWLEVDDPPLVCALTTRSPAQPRSVARREGHAFRIPVGRTDDRGTPLLGLEATAIEHAIDDAVVWAEDPTVDLPAGPWIVSPPVVAARAYGVERRPHEARDDAPRAAPAPRSALPELARWDELSFRPAGLLHVEPGDHGSSHLLLVIAPRERFDDTPEGLRLRVLGAAPSAIELPDVRPGHLLLPAPAHPFTLECRGLDLLAFVDARPVAAAAVVALEPLHVRAGRTEDPRRTWFSDRFRRPLGVPSALRARGREVFAPLLDGRPRAGELVEFLFAPPPAATEGRTWSLLIDVAADTIGVASALSFTHGGVPRFVERADDVGIARVHFEGPDLQLDIRPTMGPGLALGDVDDDGLVDLFVVQGGGREGSEVEGDTLFLNRSRPGALRFEDASAAGARDPGAGMGALFFDGDGDARLDLYVANYGADSLWANRMVEGARFGFELADVSAAAGVGGDLWSAGVTAGDPDLDGDLDLYVTSYLEYDEAAIPSDEALGFQREDPPEMLPYAFAGQRNTYLRNESTAEGLRFVDATEEAGLVDAEGRGMQAVFWDFDQDGRQDLYVANDVSINRLFHNEADGRLVDVAFSSGMDDPRGGMGVAIGDVDGDLDEDLVLTNWQLESNALYLNHLHSTSQRSRVPTFRDLAIERGIGRPSVGVTGWGAVLDDLDGDGDLDLAVANGYTSPDYESTGICVGQECHLFENDGEGHFAPVHDTWAPGFARRAAWRALGSCDFDQDGDVDLVATANNGPLAFHENVASAAHWLGVRLRGRGPNRFAVGARVMVHAGDRTHVRSLVAGTSYLTGNAPELWFGLGEHDASRVDVRWPSGATSTHEIAGANRFVTLLEPEGPR